MLDLINNVSSLAPRDTESTGTQWLTLSELRRVGIGCSLCWCLFHKSSVWAPHRLFNIGGTHAMNRITSHRHTHKTHAHCSAPRKSSMHTYYTYWEADIKTRAGGAQLLDNFRIEPLELLRLGRGTYTRHTPIYICDDSRARCEASLFVRQSVIIHIGHTYVLCVRCEQSRVSLSPLGCICGCVWCDDDDKLRWWRGVK